MHYIFSLISFLTCTHPKGRTLFTCHVQTLTTIEGAKCSSEVSLTRYVTLNAVSVSVSSGMRSVHMVVIIDQWLLEQSVRINIEFASNYSLPPGMNRM